jgi:hypothetical protein
MVRRVALYLRVSTGGQTVENQRRELAAWAERAGHEVVEVYQDSGVSGAKGREARPGLARTARPVPPCGLSWQGADRADARDGMLACRDCRVDLPRGQAQPVRLSCCSIRGDRGAREAGHGRKRPIWAIIRMKTGKFAVIRNSRNVLGQSLGAAT